MVQDWGKVQRMRFCQLKLFNMHSIDDLPNEILSAILSELTLEDRIQCKSVCRRWRWIIENLTVHSLIVTSNQVRSIVHNRLCRRHQFTTSLLIVNPLIERTKLISQDNHLTRIRALKVDLDSERELKEFKWSRLLKLLKRSSFLEHLELRIITAQNLEHLTKLTDHLFAYTPHLRHLSIKKIRYMDSLYISVFELFGQLLERLVNLTALECNLCIFRFESLEQLNLINRKQLRKLYLPDANLIGLIDCYELRSLGLGIVDEILLNQLFDCNKYTYLSRLEIKIREEFNGELIANRTIKVLTLHSLGIREKVNNILNACRSIEVLSLINCLLTYHTVQIIIDHNSSTLHSIDIQNDYWDDDRQVGHLIGVCFEKCPKLCVGYFKNINLNYFYPIIYSLANRTSTTFYKLYLDDVPDNEFDVSNKPLPVNLRLMNLLKDYNY